MFINTGSPLSSSVGVSTSGDYLISIDCKRDSSDPNYVRVTKDGQIESCCIDD